MKPVSRSPQTLIPRSRARLVGMVVGGLLVAFGITQGLVWWDERPLRLASDQGETDPLAALVMVERYLKANPDSGAAWALRACLCEKLGRFREADAIFTRIGAETFEETHAWARTKLQQRVWTSALPLLDRCLTQRPEDPDVLHELTACNERLGRFQVALAHAAKLGEHSSHRHRALFLTGTLHQELSNHRAAAAAWSEVLKLRPAADDLQVTPEEFLTQYGNELIESGQAESAREVLCRAIELRPSALAHTLLGTACLRTGQRDLAVKQWQHAVQLDPRSRLAREALAETALVQRDPAAAYEWLRPISTAHDTPSSTTYLLQRAAVARQDSEEAEVWRLKTARLRDAETRRATLHHSITTSPNAPWSRVVLAHRFAEQGNWEQAAILLTSLPSGTRQHAFVRELECAIEQHGSLPPLERIPLEP